MFERLERILPKSLSDEVKRNMTAVLENELEKMQIVSQHELDIQVKIVERLRNRISELEERLSKLEQIIDETDKIAENRTVKNKKKAEEENRSSST